MIQRGQIRVYVSALSVKIRYYTLANKIVLKPISLQARNLNQDEHVLVLLFQVHRYHLFL